ncbi:class I SAM-dependent methyltransferase [Flavobacterium sp. ZT3R18]|uniref:class I SAM-dependent methyltransferase n=1 Tax=Flavobacterium sp. ZT3R18 TaxID=2594429 RepID=UPI001179AC9A|nr:class I SAM-dependent methyltransferase [Flavobacterium sp. ZT3R18]TRX37853.1 class I SAM-dependent methyltransferase [Flavobacterium sp. ZT3R18]
MEESYLDKNNDYFSIVRKDIISFIGNEKDLNVLEIGAGTGETLLELKKRGVANRISGFDIVDINPNKEKFDCFIIGNIENQLSPFDKKEFDVIILADVLEHLIDPEKTIQKLIPCLRKGGSFYISLPNIRNIKALSQIFLKGSFEYADSGIFDRTHLRFYCKKDMIQLVSSFDELEIVKVESNLKHTSSMKTILNKLTFGVFEQFLSLQYFIKATLK